MPLPTLDPDEFRTDVDARHAEAAIIAHIADCTLRPGEQLTVAALLEWLATSRAGAERALARLAAAGYLTTNGSEVTITNTPAQA